jgi:hypothetical protein
LVITIGLIAMTFVLGRSSGHGTATQTCTGAWPVVCSHAPPG